MYLIWIALACSGASVDAPPAPVEETTAAPPEAPRDIAPAPDAAAGAAAIERARAAAGTLGETLKGRLMESMKEGGPAAAAEVCASEAQALTAKVGEEAGVSVGRASLKRRNPANEGPDWVRAWLEASDGAPAAQLEGFARVDDTPDGPRARVLVPLAVGGPCLTCHGPVEAIPQEVAALLAERYPEDMATGYAPGDLRGAIWAEATP